jgi:hypothetical protein
MKTDLKEIEAAERHTLKEHLPSSMPPVRPPEAGPATFYCFAAI